MVEQVEKSIANFRRHLFALAEQCKLLISNWHDDEIFYLVCETKAKQSNNNKTRRFMQYVDRKKSHRC